MTVYMLKHKLRSCLALLLCVLLVSLTGCSEKARPDIIINGSTTEYPILNMISKAYMNKNNVNIVLHSEGSKEGIQSLIDGQCDIAMSSSKISIFQMEQAKSNQMGLREFVFAHDMIVPIIHPSNPISDLSVEQLRAIYSGTVEDWREFGGKPGKISVAHRKRSSGTRAVWEEIVTPSEHAPKDLTLFKSNSEVLAYVATDPAAIGYISFGYVNNDIKAISVNGIEPGIQNIGSNKYPLRRELYLYVADNNFTYEMKSFIIYALSSEGQEIIKQNGFIPLYPLSLNK